MGCFYYIIKYFKELLLGEIMSNQEIASDEGNCLTVSIGCMVIAGIFTAIIGKLFSLSDDSLQVIFVTLTIIGVIFAIFDPQIETPKQDDKVIEKKKNDNKLEIGADGELTRDFVEQKKYKKMSRIEGKGISSSDPIYLIEGLYAINYEFRERERDSFTELRASIAFIGVDTKYEKEIISDISSKGSVTFRVPQSGRYIFQTHMKFFHTLTARTRVMSDPNRFTWEIECKLLE